MADETDDRMIFPRGSFDFVQIWIDQVKASMDAFRKAKLKEYPNFDRDCNRISHEEMAKAACGQADAVVAQLKARIDTED